MNRRELLTVSAIVTVAGCMSDTDQPSDESEEEQNNDLEADSDPGDTTGSKDNATDNDSDAKQKEANGDEKEQGDKEDTEEDKPTPEEKELLEFIDAAQTLVNEAIRIYTDTAGEDQTDPAKIGVSSDFPRTDIVNKTLDTDDKLNEAIKMIERHDIDDKYIQDLEPTRSEAALIRIAARGHDETIKHYQAISDAVQWVENESYSHLRRGLQELEEEQEALDERIGDLEIAYNQSSEYGNEYVKRIGSVPDLLREARKTSPKLVGLIEDLWSTVDNELRDGHQAYRDGNYNTAMSWADTAARNFDDLSDEADNIPVPEGGDGVRNRIIDEADNRLEEARELRRDAAKAADDN